jgi:hypothetical protein
VWWPFVAGLVLAWLVTRLDRAPLAWGRAVVAWLPTVAVGMTLRIAVEGHSSVAFTVVTLLFVGAGMLAGGRSCGPCGHDGTRRRRSERPRIPGRAGV